MKKIIPLLFIIVTNILHSQISVTTEVEKTQKPVEKPEPYDKLTNINQKTLKNNVDYYYGLSGFFVPYEAFNGSIYTEKPILNRWVNSEVKYNGYSFELNSDEIKEKLANQKFIVKEGIAEKDLRTLLKAKADSIKQANSKIDLKRRKIYNELASKGSAYEKIDSIKKAHPKIELTSRDIYNVLGSYGSIFIKIESQQTGEQFYYAPYGRNFILDDYFNNLKDMYLNQSVRVTNNERWLNDSRNKVLNLSTDEKINLPFKSQWLVSDITLFKVNNSYELSLILENNDIGKILYTLDPTEKDNFNRNVSMGMNNGYNIALESDYQISVLKNQKIKAEKEKIRQQEIKKIEKAKLVRKNDLISKYGNDYGMLIYQGKVDIGMSKSMCADAWGYPISKKTIVTEIGKLTQWTYYQNRRLLFRDDKLAIIEY